MNKLEQTYLIAAPLDQVWRALTNVRVIRQWSGASAVFPRKQGGAYALWDGSITGKIVSLVPHKKLVQTWKPDNWTIEDSRVTFTLTPQVQGTRVDLVHENVEEWDYEGTEAGWDTYYLGAIKRMLETPTVTKPAKKKSVQRAKQPKRVAATRSTKSKK